MKNSGDDVQHGPGHDPVKIDQKSNRSSSTEGEELIEDVFTGKEDPERVADTLSTFADSYSRHKDEMPLEDWLTQEFRNRSDIWPSSESARSEARTLINEVKRYLSLQDDLQTHHRRGLSTGNWLAQKIEEGAAANGVVQVRDYGEQISRAMEDANARNREVVTRSSDGFINQCPNLDGFIAEQHHANTFNLDAATKGSPYRAKVLNPWPNPYGQNSADIGIYDDKGRLARRYQAKYGKNAKITWSLFERGNYTGQRKLVPDGQAQDIKNGTSVIEIDGIHSRPLSKEEAKRLQERVQRGYEAKRYDWKSLDKTAFARLLAWQIMMGTCLIAAFHGGRIIARRVWNKMRGRENQSLNKDMSEFFQSILRSTTSLGIQVAVSGGLLVAARSGWLGQALKLTPAGRIAVLAMLALDNAKVLYKLGKGELNCEESLDEMGSVTAIAMAGMACAVKGCALGGAVGTMFGPVGTLVGGFVGGIAGGIAGSAIGDVFYKGAKATARAVFNKAKTAAEGFIGVFDKLRSPQKIRLEHA